MGEFFIKVSCSSTVCSYHNSGKSKRFTVDASDIDGALNELKSFTDGQPPACNPKPQLFKVVEVFIK